MEERSVELRYLNNKPKTIYWTVIAGNRKLNFYESYDLIYDQKDLNIRKIHT